MADPKKEEENNSAALAHAAQPIYALTTVDNPFSPFTQFTEWNAFDTTRGYHSAAFLARITVTSDDLSDADQEQAIQMAIDEIVSENVSGMWRKVTRDSFELKEKAMGD